ncbi:ParB N-terminal domain-containing protein [Streptomyces sp. NBC_00631]|uniref:ParB/RepB/Spo0J family partition protein n=1 Tax=Streptomyces sp. NBC_00631 TaxID=2975793 RepID=UPI0030DE4316
MSSVRLSTLITCESPRLSGEDEEHIRVLAESGAQLPPIVACRRNLRVIDGHHRVRAAMLRGDDHIAVQFFDGPDDEAFILAVRLNVEHGLPLTRADRHSAAQRILRTHPDWSNRLIAELSGISDKSVARLRCATAELPQSHSRTGCDGRTRPLTTQEGRQRAARLLAEQPDASLRRIARASGISVGTARDVKDRLGKGLSPLPDAARQGSRLSQPETAEEDVCVTPLRLDGRQQLLVALTKDPSLRLTDVGRKFLRLALAHPNDVRSWDRLVEGLPPHCLDHALQLARSHVEAWLHFSTAVEQRKGRAD